MLILLMAGCAIAGMQTAGPLADRLGSRTLTATEVPEPAGMLLTAAAAAGLLARRRRRPEV